jgi:hypothetical protein
MFLKKAFNLLYMGLSSFLRLLKATKIIDTVDEARRIHSDHDDAVREADKALLRAIIAQGSVVLVSTGKYRIPSLF